MTESPLRTAVLSPNQIAGELDPLGSLRSLFSGYAAVPLRLWAVGAALASESCLVAAMGHPWLHTGQIMTGPIAFVAALLFLGRRRLEIERLTAHRLNGSLILLHLLALVGVLASAAVLLRSSAWGLPAPRTALVFWYIALAAMIVSLPAALAPGAQLLLLIRRLGSAWLMAALCGTLAMSFRRLELVAWDAPDSTFGRLLAGAAFRGVHLLLGLGSRPFTVDPVHRIIGMAGFRIRVAGVCSGMEGLALMLALTLSWIFVERRSLRVARSLWLVPVALLLIWILNLVRMVALILLGAAGHPQMAVKGFHTQAGWIAFTIVGIGFLSATHRIAWFRKPDLAKPLAATPSLPLRPAPVETPAAPYLLPLLALLATMLATQAVSTGFEWLYPLRLLVTSAVLWTLRSHYKALPWRCGIADLVLGSSVGALWIACAHGADSTAIREGLRMLAPGGRALWLLSQALGTVLIVPLAEELAFRGYLARRLVSPLVDRTSFRAVGLLPAVLSSLAFGLLHGKHWLLGTVSGCVFLLAARRRNSVGSAVAAHASANLMLALWAFTTGDLSLW